MAKAARRPPPHVQVRFALAGMRAEGVPFDRAWPEAISAVKWPYDTANKRQWRTALVMAENEWRAAYEGQPSRVSLIAAALLSALDDVEGIDRNDYELVAA